MGQIKVALSATSYREVKDMPCYRADWKRMHELVQRFRNRIIPCS